MKINTDLEIEIPTVPNFVRIKSTGSDRETATISIGELGEEALNAIAARWKVELIEKAAISREQLAKSRSMGQVP